MYEYGAKLLSCHVFDVALGQGHVSKFCFGQVLNVFDLLKKQIIPDWEIFGLTKSQRAWKNIPIIVFGCEID